MERYILELYPELDGESSTILTALQTGRASYSALQDINDCQGERALLESTIVPIIVDGRVECAMDSSKCHITDQRVTRGGEDGGLPALDQMLAEDPAMLTLKNRVWDVVGLDPSVLTYGEMGTGKELVAESPHSEGGWAGPFVSQSCAAIPATLLENLFSGTEKRSYAGILTHRGLLEEADGGTLPLDGVDSMDPAFRAKLPKVLEEKKVRRLEGSRDIPFDMWVVATANKKSQELIREGRLRENLYYCLGMIHLSLPPLREWLRDISPLTDCFIEHYNRELHWRMRGLSERALRLLRGYVRPGNVRKLKNAIEKAVAVARRERLTVEDMEEILVGRLGGLNRPSELPEALCLEESFSLTRALGLYERELFNRAMQQADSISQVARLLGLSWQNLEYKLEKFDLQRTLRRKIFSP